MAGSTYCTAEGNLRLHNIAERINISHWRCGIVRINKSFASMFTCCAIAARVADMNNTANSHWWHVQTTFLGPFQGRVGQNRHCTCLLAVVPLHHAIAHVSHRAQTSSQRRRISFEGKNLKLHWKLQLSPVPCCLCYIVIRLFFLSPPLLLDVYFQKVKMRQLNATIFTCLAAQNNSNIKITFALHLFDPARAPLLKPCTV